MFLFFYFQSPREVSSPDINTGVERSNKRSLSKERMSPTSRPSKIARKSQSPETAAQSASAR